MDRSAMTKLARPRALIFDLDNTLYSYRTCHEPAQVAMLSRLAVRFNLDLPEVTQAYDASRSATKARLGDRASAHSRLLYLLKTFEILGFGPRPDDALSLEQVYWREYLARVELADGVADLFNNIKASKIPLVLATDLTAAIQIRKLIVLGLTETFDYIVTSEECESEKTSGGVYAVLCEKMEAQKGPHLWVIGDSDADMLAKRHLGATTIFANFFNGAAPAHQPDLTVTSAAQLNWAIEIAGQHHG